MKLGIQSASRIVEAFLKHLSDLPDVEVTAMCVRPQSEEKARAMLQKAGLDHVALYTDEAAYLADPSYDFTYNGTVNHLHYEQAKRALLAGRNVILEKPFTVTLAETEELFRIADERGLWLFEAITTPYMPGFARIAEALPKIAPVRAVTVNFSKYSTRYDDYLAGRWTTTFDPACAGGALMDMNVYCLHLVTALFGAPEDALYLPNVGRNGIDIGGVAVLTYPDFRAALVSCKDSSAPYSVVIQGEKGTVNVPCAANSLQDARTDEKFRMAYEFTHFAEAFRQNDRAAYDRAKAQTLTVMRLIDDMRKAIPAYQA